MDTRNLKGQRVAIYARYSSDNQREASIDDQVRRCRDHLERAGGSVVPDLVFADYALSGSSLQRPAFEKMMTLVEAKRRDVDAIVTEDLSRITRDFADGAMVFKKLQYLGVPLLGIADGIDTSARGAKLSYTVKTLLADMYLDELRDKTLRGLEGRALRGFSTGALPIGYRSREEKVARGGIVGYAIEIDEAQAAVVRRVFDEYLARRSLSGIAALLNAEGVASPRASSPRRRKGWMDSTIRAILHNRSYVGEWFFKRREWRRVPGTNRRLPRLRAESEVLVLPRPHLRIIDDETWVAVEARLRSVRALFVKSPTEGRSGPSHAGRKTDYLLSTIIVCDRCGAPMMISGGVPERYYRCGDNHKRKTCPNALTVREGVARKAILAALRAQFLSPEGILYARRLIAEKLGEAERGASAKRREHEERLARTEARIHGLVAFIADGNRSDYVAQQLRDLEAHAAVEKQAITELRERAAKPISLPSPDEVIARVFALETHLMGDVLRGREALRALFSDGKIRLVPQPDGVYLARAELLPLALLLTPDVETPAPGVSRSGSKPARSCGGRI